MSLLFHRRNVYLMCACSSWCTARSECASRHHFGLVRAACQLELCLISTTSTYSLLLKGRWFSVTLSVRVQEDFSSNKRHFTPHAHTVKAVLALNLILAFFSESRKKAFHGLDSAKDFFFLAFNCQITSLFKLSKPVCNSSSRLLFLARQMKQSQTIEVHLC